MVILGRTRTQILVAVTFFVLAGISVAANDKAVGKELIERAWHLSDIRSDGAPAFRLEGTFRVTAKKGGMETQGTYTEIWVSKTKWRQEEQTSSTHRIEIGAGTKKWIASSGTDRLPTSFYLSPTLLFPRETPEPKVTKISERKIDSANAACVESKSQWSKGIDCVDPGSGVLLLHEIASMPNSIPSHQVCLYRNYEKFGDRLFPRFARCTSDPGEDVELTIVKLVAESPSEETLFTRPQGAIEAGNCQGGVAKPPHAEYSPDPGYPDHHNENTTVVIWTIIAVDGKPQDVRIARSGGQDFDRLALEIAQKWRFKPATCDGLPMPAQINIEIAFRKF